MVWFGPAAIGCAPKQLAGHAKAWPPIASCSNTKATLVPGDSVDVSTVDEVTSPVSTILNVNPEPGLNAKFGVAENGVQLRKIALMGMVYFRTARPDIRAPGLACPEINGCTPVPESVDVCGLPEAPSTTDTDADRAPTAKGVKVTVMVQDELVPKLEPTGQLFD